MNGDLSLSRALGGLRIANPDDAPPTSSSAAAAQSMASADGREPHTDSQAPPSLGRREADIASDQAQGRDAYLTSSTGSQPPRQTAPPSSTPMSLGQADINRSQPPHQSPDASRAAGAGGPSSTPYAQRPVSTAYPQHQRSADMAQMAATPDGRADMSRSSMYLPSRTDSYSNQSYQPSAPSREPSQSDRSFNANRHVPLPPGNGPPPPRRSSRGMAGGYMSTSQPGPSQTGPPQPSQLHGSGPEIPLPVSSKEWQDRGASVSVRREVDANGQTVIRHVKKGVRDFSFGRILGEGSYSTVYLATDRQTLKEYAIKVLEKKHIIKEKKIKYVNIEKNTLNRLTEHPGIVRLYYTFQDEACLYYALDFCSGGELLGVLKKTGTFDVECTRFYGAQILDAVDYMHSRGVLHRDLKPENVLLDDHMHVKITDFGTAKMLPDPREPRTHDGRDRGLPDGGQSQPDDDGRAQSFVGTAEYVSPELLTNKNSCKASDLWAFGCIIYQLLAGRPPFKAGSEYLTFQKIVGLDYDFPPGFPPAARDLVERLLVLDPARRLTVEHIKNHEFFDGQQFGTVLWRTKAPRLRPYVPPAQEPHRDIIQLNGFSNSPQAMGTSRGHSQSQSSAVANGAPRAPRVITELPPPTQLDFEWSPVLTRSNERILKLGDLMVVSTPLPNSPHGKGGDHGEGHKKLARFFGGSTTKKRQRLVMVTSSGRIILAPAGGEEKRAKQELSLLSPDCSWKSQLDAKGQPVWCVDTGGVHYTFEEPKPQQGSEPGGPVSVDDWIESLERARDLAISQNVAGSYGSDNGFGEMSSTMSSPASTLGGRATYPEGFGISDRSGRNHLSKSQASLEESSTKRNRFSKRQSKNGLGSAF